MYTGELLEDLIKKSKKRWGNISKEFKNEFEETAKQILIIYQYDLPPEKEPVFFLKLHLKE
jgi:hypothetical protein